MSNLADSASLSSSSNKTLPNPKNNNSETTDYYDFDQYYDDDYDDDLNQKLLTKPKLKNLINETTTKNITTTTVKIKIKNKDDDDEEEYNYYGDEDYYQLAVGDVKTVKDGTLSESVSSSTEPSLSIETTTNVKLNLVDSTSETMLINDDDDKKQSQENLVTTQSPTIKTTNEIKLKTKLTSTSTSTKPSTTTTTTTTTTSSISNKKSTKNDNQDQDQDYYYDYDEESNKTSTKTTKTTTTPKPDLKLKHQLKSNSSKETDYYYDYEQEDESKNSTSKNKTTKNNNDDDDDDDEYYDDAYYEEYDDKQFDDIATYEQEYDNIFGQKLNITTTSTTTTSTTSTTTTTKDEDFYGSDSEWDYYDFNSTSTPNTKIATSNGTTSLIYNFNLKELLKSPALLAGIFGGLLVGIITASLCLIFIIYRMKQRKFKDPNTYMINGTIKNTARVHYPNPKRSYSRNITLLSPAVDVNGGSSTSTSTNSGGVTTGLLNGTITNNARLLKYTNPGQSLMRNLSSDGDSSGGGGMSPVNHDGAFNYAYIKAPTKEFYA